MKELKRNSKQAERIIQEFKYYKQGQEKVTSVYRIYDIYNNCSEAKRYSLQKLINKYFDLVELNHTFISNYLHYSDFGLYLGGHNCMMYSAYTFINGLCLIKHTNYNDYYIDLKGELLEV